MKIGIISFTERGNILAQSIKENLVEHEIKCVKGFGREKVNFKEWTKSQFESGDGLIFISAMGICVRAIAPFIQDKTKDPFVIVLDELGSNCISVLSGHIGRGNLLTETIASKIGANPVITTATDVNHIFAIDNFAIENGFALKNTSSIKLVSAKFLRGGTVIVKSDFKLKNLPQNMIETKISKEADVVITYKKTAADHQLVLIPPVLHLGMGCRKDKDSEEVAQFLEEVLDEYHLEKRAIKDFGSVELKKEEQAFLTLVSSLKIKPNFFTIEELNQVNGEFESSDFVRKTIGTDNVCERSAVNLGGRLIVKKQAKEGMTLAISLDEIEIDFKEKRG